MASTSKCITDLNKTRASASAEAIFTALPEGAAAAFYIMKKANTKNGLYAMLLSVPSMTIPEFDFTGASIYETSGFKGKFYAPSKRPAWFQQAMHIMGPISYIFSTLQAALAVKLNWYQTALVALGNYTEQVLRSYYSYDEWALKNSAKRFFEHKIMYGTFMLLDSLGIPDAMKHAWTGLEGFIHYKGVSEFQAWNPFFAKHVGLNHSLALITGLSQMTFTRAFDIREFYHLMHKFDKIQNERSPQWLKSFSGFFKEFWKELLANPVAELFVKGKLISFIKLKLFETMRLGGVSGENALRSMLFFEAACKTYTGVAMGAIGGETAFDELSAFFDMGENAKTGLILFGMIGYAMSNALQAYGKYSAAKPELKALYLGKNMRWLFEPTLLPNHKSALPTRTSRADSTGSATLMGDYQTEDLSDHHEPVLEATETTSKTKTALGITASFAISTAVTLGAKLFADDPLMQAVSIFVLADTAWALGKTLLPRAQTAWTSFWENRAIQTQQSQFANLV